MEITFKIKKITVLIVQCGTDIVMIEPDLPSPFPAMQYAPSFKLETSRNHAVSYVKTNFPGIPFHVIDTSGDAVKEYDVE